MHDGTTPPVRKLIHLVYLLYFVSNVEDFYQRILLTLILTKFSLQIKKNPETIVGI